MTHLEPTELATLRAIAARHNVEHGHLTINLSMMDGLVQRATVTAEHNVKVESQKRVKA